MSSIAVFEADTWLREVLIVDQLAVDSVTEFELLILAKLNSRPNHFVNSPLLLRSR